MTDKQATLCFVDTETSSLDAETGEIWEVGVIRREPGGASDAEHCWLLPVTLEHADPISLGVGGFHERHPQGNGYTGGLGHPDDPGATSVMCRLAEFAHRFASITHGAHLVGAVVSFDEERLRRLLRSQGVMPSWSYHLIDVEALTVGWLRGQGLAHITATPPWNSRELSAAIGVEMPSDDERHTALGDSRWAMRLFDAVMGVT